MNHTIIIIGGGHAGFQLSHSLRRDGYKGRIVIFEKQRNYPYQRPPLSKAFLLDKISQERILFRSPDFYSQNNIELFFSAVKSIDRKRKVVVYDSGKILAYDELVLAVGVSPKKLENYSEQYKNVYSFSSLQSTVELKKELALAKSVIVIGTGFIGLEFASVARSQGKEVHVISSGDQVMKRSISLSLSEIIKSRHIAHGVNFHDNNHIEIWTGERGNVVSVTLASGLTLRSDLVIVGIGSTPNIQLAVSAGLETENGIIVDDGMCTSDPSIYAIGDCALFPYVDHIPIRLESVQNAVDQSRYLSRRIVHKELRGYYSMPWFWSDQGEMKIQVAGVNVNSATSHKLETVLLGDNIESGYSCFCFVKGTLVIVETINRPAVHMIARKILSGERHPTLSELSSVNFDLAEWEHAVIQFGAGSEGALQWW